MTKKHKSKLHFSLAVKKVRHTGFEENLAVFDGVSSFEKVIALMRLWKKWYHPKVGEKNENKN